VKDHVANVYMSESYFSRKTFRSCHLGQNHVIDLTVKSYPYKKEKLNVKKGKVDLNKKDLARVIREKKIKANLYNNSASYYLFNEPFTLPLKSYVTSHYGNVRLFNNKKRSQHLGNDFRAAIGVPIPVANRGRVVYVGNLFFSGNVVVVDHGLDIFTLYGHLSKIQTTKGSIVNKGDIIGLAGMTGRVSGPHLHWGVKINGNSVDGFSLTKESELQFVADDEMAK
jgi:murein DD-endopeptidase MepM/ murein hydrolase activator NlpD